MQWLQDPNQNSVDNLDSVRCENIRHFRNNKKEYMKTKIDELETNSKKKKIRDLYRGISDFKKGYQPRGDYGGTVVKVLCYKSEGRWFDSRWCHWNFSLT